MLKDLGGLGSSISLSRGDESNSMGYSGVVKLERAASMRLGEVWTKCFVNIGHRTNANMQLASYLPGRLTSIKQIHDIVDNILGERFHDDSD